MSKKRWIAVFACILPAALFLIAACTGLFSSVTTDSRYPSDVAAERGEEGSPDNFLASHDTPTTELRRMFEEARADGSFEGNYFEYLVALGVQEDNGAHVQETLRSVVSVGAVYSQSALISQASYGAGVVYSLDAERGDAIIVTNFHVVYDEDLGTGRETVPYVSNDIRITPYGWSDYLSASFLGGSSEYDIAVLEVTNAPALKEGVPGGVFLKELVACDSDSVTVGERVYAIGNPQAHGVAVSEGVISVALEYATYAGLKSGQQYITVPQIRTDADVNHGTSGGGLFNASGEFVGIVNGRSEEDGVVGFGFAIPSNVALGVAQNIIDTCRKTPAVHGGAMARLGITPTVVGSHSYFDEETGKAYIEEKLVVSNVTAGGPASSMGLRQGDTLVSAKITGTRNGKAYELTVPLTRSVKIDEALLEVRLGDTLTLTVSRSDRTQEYSYAYSATTDFKTLD